MFFQILGDMGVAVGDEWRSISAGRQRAALCVLALSSNRTVSRASLVDAIWGDRVPQHPETALQIIVSRLRTALGPAAATRLISVGAGYRLDVASDELDFTVVQSRFILGRSLLHDNEAHRAADILELALAAWTDEILADLREFPFARDACTELQELRNAIEQSFHDALLACGRHVEVLARLQGAISVDPWREDLRRQRMLALYRSGRQVEALREFDEFRALLVDEFGVEPTEETQELRLRILDQDGTLLLPKRGVRVPVPPWTATSMPFVGRSDEEEAIFARLREVATGARRFILIEGEPGIGKTRLVMEVARRISEDAILIPATANDATQGTLRTLAEAFAVASVPLGDTELRLCLGPWPGDIAAVVPAIDRRFPDVALPVGGERLYNDRLRESLIWWAVSLSQRAPVVIVIDDIHRAGPALFMFLGRLLAREGHQRVLVLATARSRALDYSSKLEELLSRLQQQDVLDRVVLEGLDEDSLEGLLAATGVSDAAARAHALHASTGGHPFFVGELVQAGDWQADIPVSVREFVRQRVSDLGLAEQRTLEHAAGFLTGFTAEVLAEVSGITTAIASAHIDRALNAAILRSYEARLFTFVHELTRRALTESLDDETSAMLHRRIALALEAHDAPAAVLAEHWQRAAGEDARERTFTAASAAASDAVRSLEPETATHWYELAVRSATSPAQEARALLALAEVQHELGDAACLSSLRAAIDHARAHDDSDLLVACATMWTPIWSSMPPLEPEEKIALLEDACDATHDAAVHSRIAARLASELLTSKQRHRAPVLAREALDEVNTTDSCSAKREVAMRYFHATWCPHSLDERRTLIARTVDHTPADEVLDRCFALSLQGAAAIEAADLEGANLALDEMLSLSEAVDIGVLRENAINTRAWRAALAGDMERGTDLATRALASVRYKDPRATAGVALQLVLIAWQRGRLGNLMPLLRAIDPEMAGPGATNLILARAYSAAGDADSARQILEPISWRDLEALPTDMLWATSLIMAAECAFTLGLDQLAGHILRLLEPFQSQVAFANCVVGPIAYGAALAAAASRQADFDPLFAHALEICDTLRAPVLRARTEIAWTIASHAGTQGAERRKRIRAIADDARTLCSTYQLDELRQPDDVASWRLI